jgi:hypothetical protein
MIARDELHTILDSIPEDRLEAARQALAALADPVLLAFLSAPEVDEPLTDEDLRAFADGDEDQTLGRTVSLGDIIDR